MKLILLILFFLPYVQANSQESPGKIIPGIYSGFSLSQTGVNFTTGLSAQKGKFMLQSGPKIGLSEMAGISGPYGVANTLYYFIGEKCSKTAGFINADYQVLFMKRFGSQETRSSFNSIHEYSVGYGVKLSVSEKLSVMSAINAGKYSERFNNPERGKYIVSGYNTVIKLGVNFKL